MKNLVLISLAALLTCGFSNKNYNNELAVQCFVSDSPHYFSKFQLLGLDVNGERQLVIETDESENIGNVCLQNEMIISCEWHGNLKKVYQVLVDIDMYEELTHPTSKSQQIGFTGFIMSTGLFSDKKFDDPVVIECFKI